MPSVQIDDQFDLFGGFVAEIEGYLPVIAANVRHLVASPGTEDLLEESHRFAHTIKSSAAMIGIPELRSIAAPMEALLARAYAGDVAIDAAVVATIDGALLRIRSCLALQQAGGDMRELVRQNDLAFSALRTVAPGQFQEPSEDARDRLQHAITGTADLLLTGNAAEDDAPLPPDTDDFVTVDVSFPPAPAASETGLDAASATLSRPDQSVLPGTEPNRTGDAPERPRLTVLTGGAPVGTSASSPSSTYSIAAEWLAEILGGGPTDAEPAPPSAEVAAPAIPAERWEDWEQHRQEWEQRLNAERSALEAQLERERRETLMLIEAERQASAEQQQRLLEQHEVAIRALEEERELALQTQREALEQEVQRYIEEDLRPQLEDEIRQEVTHEFELAALLDPAPHAVTANRPAVKPVYAYAEDAALAAEMREIFAQEAAEHIQAIGEQTLALRRQPDDLEHLQALRRSVHTLKGAAATVGVVAVSALCHQVETMLDQALESGATPGGPEQTLLLLESCDTLEALIGGDAIATEQARVLAERLSAITGIALPEPTFEAAELAIPDFTGTLAVGQMPDDLATWETALPVPVAASAPANPAERGQDHAPASATLALRVPLSELDRLLAANHELIITESALELRLQRLQRTLDDVRHTGDRLRVASSRLESGRSVALPPAGGSALEPAVTAVPAPDGAEAPNWRAALRRQSAAGLTGEFDSLEMDQYTEYHRLTREVAEAALDVTTSDVEIGDVLDDLRLTLKQQQRLHGSQNQVLLNLRMVPLQLALPRLARAVQALAAQQGKQVEFVVEGADTLVDRAVMEEVADALLHLVRNAVDHGVESAEVRRAAGKPEKATLCLSAQRVGPETSIVLADDGPGLDTAAIRRSALARGLILDDAQLSDVELQQLVFAPGLSTAATITDISGRGVGLDVVRANIQALRGKVVLTSQAGVGTTFTLNVPSSLSLLTVALVEAAGNTYAIPLTLVRHVEKVPMRRVRMEDGRQIVRHGGRAYPVVDLAALVELPSSSSNIGNPPLSLVFISAGQGTVALVVDKLAGKREVVVKDLGEQLRRVRGVHGATALGNGDLALILDVPALLQQEHVEYRAPVAKPREAPMQRQLLVVDDSPSVRRLTCAVFERQGWLVRPARDGVEALDLLQGWRPDAVVMDIEMPRMDGFELLSILRHQPETADLPAVMVTSRAGEKHREKAVRLGINAYLVKPFREEELLGTVDSLLAQSSLTVPASTR